VITFERVFSLTYLQRLSSSLYLSMLSVADIVFLLALLVVWLERVDAGLFTRDGWCQTVTYASRVSGFLAAWHVVVFTAERYVIVHHPLRKDEFCTKGRARLVVAAVVAVSLLLYAPTTWTHDVIRFGHVAVCAPLPRHQYVTTAMATVDTLTSCIVPSIIIVVLNGRIIHKIRRYQTSAFDMPPSGRNEAAAVAVVAATTLRRRSLVQTSVSASGSMHIKFTSKAVQQAQGPAVAGTTQPAPSPPDGSAMPVFSTIL
jgi:7 transmembrane receptor (rhodopsin family)